MRQKKVPSLIGPTYQQKNHTLTSRKLSFSYFQTNLLVEDLVP